MRLRRKTNWEQKIAKLLRLPEGQIQPERRLEELIVDSFAFVEMALALQEEFGVRLDQQDLRGIQTVGDLVEALEAKA